MKPIQKTENIQRTWLLRDKHGRPIFEGDLVQSDDETYKVTGGAPPHKEGSTGKVYVQNVNNDGGERSLFVTVFNLKWISFDEQV